MTVLSFIALSVVDRLAYISNYMQKTSFSIHEVTIEASETNVTTNSKWQMESDPGGILLAPATIASLLHGECSVSFFIGFATRYN